MPINVQNLNQIFPIQSFPIQISILLINFVHLKNIQSERCFLLRRYKHKIPTSISYFSPNKKKILK